MPDPVSQILAAVRLASPPIALAAAILTGALIFAPRDWLDVISLGNAREYYRVEIGLVFLASLSLLIAFSWPVIRKWAMGKYDARVSKVQAEESLRQQKQEAEERLRQRQQLLHKLLPEEKGILVPYIKDGTTSRMFDMGNGIVGGLVARDILFRSSNVGEVYSFPYNLQPWAREYLEANPHLLDGAKVPPKRRVI